MSLTVEASQSEVQELWLAADYQREVQSILVKALAQDGSTSAAVSEFAEQQLVTVEVWRNLFSGIVCSGIAHKLVSDEHAVVAWRASLSYPSIFRCSLILLSVLVAFCSRKFREKRILVEGQPLKMPTSVLRLALPRLGHFVAG